MKCSICKQDLPESAFYPSERSRCRECHKKKKRELHLAKVKPQFGVALNEKGQLINFQGHKKNIHWSGNMISQLKKYYPCTTNAELAELLNVSPRTVVRKARELGLAKDEDWMKSVAREHAFLGGIGKARSCKLKSETK